MDGFYTRREHKGYKGKTFNIEGWGRVRGSIMTGTVHYCLRFINSPLINHFQVRAVIKVFLADMWAKIGRSQLLRGLCFPGRGMKRERRQQ